MEDMVRYLEQIVEPTIRDFEENPTSVRHAFLACVAVFHATDYLAYPRRRPAGLRQEFRRASSAFAIVDDVAHAFKHVAVGNRQRPHLKSDQIIARPPAYYDVSGAWDLSRWDDPIGGVTLDAARNIDLLDAIKATVAFLRDQKTMQPPEEKAAL
jgi:hypothetical protein